MVAESTLQAARERIAEIEDGATVAILGAGGGILEPDMLIEALAAHYAGTGHPRDLTLYHTLGLGNRKDRGLAPLAREGLVARAIGGHLGQTPAMARLAEQEKIEAYNLPAGVMSLLLREITGGRPGLITKIGLGTFIDPRIEGGRLNDRSTADLVEVIELTGEEWLFYPAPKFDVALIRASSADEDGNLTMQDEPSYLDVYALAAATTACGGRVIAQVKEIVPRGSLHPKQVHVPALFVHDVVEHPQQWQTYEAEQDDVFAGHERVDLAAGSFPFGSRKLIARRAATELSPGDVVNLGVGTPDGVATVLQEEGVADEVVFTVEHGIFGGVTAQGHVFGASRNHAAVVHMPDMFDLYHGGGLDAAFLGFAQVDREGNVNVSKFGGTVMGTGGFIDITQRARMVVFCGSLTASGLDVEYEDHRIHIKQEGRIQKLVDRVDQITFSGEHAQRTGQRVVIVTERAVFELRERGLTLVEIVEGTDVERDVLAQMGFEPEIADPLERMPKEIVSDGPMGLAQRWR